MKGHYEKVNPGCLEDVNHAKACIQNTMGFVKEPLHVHGPAPQGRRGLLETQQDVSSGDNVAAECKLSVAPARMLSIASGPRVINRFSRLRN